MRNTRRSFLALAGAGAVVATTGAASADTETVEGDADEIPAPFDELPLIEQPSAYDRSQASTLYPPAALPDEGPIPDWRHSHVVEREFVIPEWAIEAVRWRLQEADDVDRAGVEERLAEYAYVREQFVTPDGRDAVDVLLDEHDDTEAASGGDS